MAKVFYSWQTDLETTTCRNLIRKALEQAVVELSKSETEFEEPEREDEGASDIEDEEGEAESAERQEVTIDSDTSGVPGSPPSSRLSWQKSMPPMRSWLI